MSQVNSQSNPQPSLPETTVSVNLTSSQIQFLTQHLEVEFSYLEAKINECYKSKASYPAKLIARANKIAGILTNLGA